ncbi:hypothetical protein EC396_13395 [Lutibacter sp. HS1-25]|uniref:hypothetical protein n=1 Tax=Lutibacter sp. HS1-25 TaxID=2485000 RepID=UPI00101165B5|nr:hypothetical protein [Lutibacter sp. HS1-25]RXP46869.1 hypothetical protein EC396_13395 [Lutibacter sp. HS1-25]
MANGIKTSGRTIGTLNKTTKEIRTVLKDVINKELTNIATLLAKLEPKERVELIIKLIPYVLSKVESVNYSLGEPMDWDL